MKKTACQIVFLLAMMGALVMPTWAEETTQSGTVAKKYPPYPDVWGYELPWPQKPLNRDARIQVYAMKDGDYFVTYASRIKKFKKPNGQCCEEEVTLAGFSFYSGPQKHSESEKLGLMRNFTTQDRVATDQVVFRDGSRIEQVSDQHNNCYFPLPYTLLKKDSIGHVVMKKRLLYLPDSSRKQKVGGAVGCSEPVESFNEKVHEVSSRFIPQSDDTFLLFDSGGNFILRFDKDLKTQYALGGTLFLIDSNEIEDLITASADNQAIQDAVHKYLIDLKERKAQ